MEDPANPSGNDVTGLLTSSWPELSLTAASTLRMVEDAGWEGVFGKAEKKDESARSADLQSAAAAVVAPTRPRQGSEYRTALKSPRRLDALASNKRFVSGIPIFESSSRATMSSYGEAFRSYTK